MKRIITGVNAAGKSCVLSREVITPQPGEIVYDYTPNEQLQKWLADLDPNATANWIGPQVPGGARWILAQIPPHGFEGHHPARQGMDEEGFHTTNTIDFVYVLAGDLTLILDEESVDLESGDIVIQQATRHAWRNGDKGSTHVALLYWPPE